MKFLVSYVQDDMYATTTPIEVFNTIEEAKAFILKDYFEGDKETMDEWEEIIKKDDTYEYIDDCKGARIEKMRGGKEPTAQEATRKLNDSDNYESIGTFKLSKKKTPIAFAEKVAELMEEEGMSEEESEECVSDMEFELEIYYEKGFGLFAVETDAIEQNIQMVSPYTGRAYEPWDEEE